MEKGADLTVRNNEDKDAFEVADEKDHFECKSLISRWLEKNGFSRTSNSNSLIIGQMISDTNELSKNFEIKNRIR